ncbi:MAG: hypothetical protein JO305_00915 [Alphaproteobacteria bacterium]|nr:hypothetical protein [Alphaproteobacteria bacterium]
MSEPKDFSGRAAQCERLAATTLYGESREILLKIAARWRSLAREEESRGTASTLGSVEPATEPY